MAKTYMDITILCLFNLCIVKYVMIGGLEALRRSLSVHQIAESSDNPDIVASAGQRRIRTVDTVMITWSPMSRCTKAGRRNSV